MMVGSMLRKSLTHQPTAEEYARSRRILDSYYLLTGDDLGQGTRSGVEVSLDSNSTSRYVNSSSMVPMREDGTDGTLQ